MAHPSTGRGSAGGQGWKEDGHIFGGGKRVPQAGERVEG